MKQHQITYHTVKSFGVKGGNIFAILKFKVELSNSSDY